MKSKKLKDMLKIVETDNRQKVSDLEILDASQSKLIRGGLVSRCPICDGVGGIPPPITPPPKG